MKYVLSLVFLIVAVTLFVFVSSDDPTYIQVLMYVASVMTFIAALTVYIKKRSK